MARFLICKDSPNQRLDVPAMWMPVAGLIPDFLSSQKKSNLYRHQESVHESPQPREACKINGKKHILEVLFLSTNFQGSLGQKKAPVLSISKDGGDESHSRCLQDKSISLYKEMLYPNIKH